MQTDPDSLGRYDEYHQGQTREVITVETKIKPTNKGFAMLEKMGWVEGQPVGLSGDGTCCVYAPCILSSVDVQAGWIPSLSLSRMTRQGSARCHKT